jgi:ATP-binding cassette subfamily F protein 3
MEYIRGHNIGFRFEGQADILLEKVSFSLNDAAKIGVVGDNGCGKTTLLNIMLGNLKIASGDLIMRKGITIGYLPQEVDLSEAVKVHEYLRQARANLFQLLRKIENTDESTSEYANLISEYYECGGGEYDVEIKKILAGFDIGDDKFELPVASLSGGEKTKTAMARILLRQPDVMLLDEPTNHLEIASLVWLEEYLNSISIPYIVVSHDRRFLDKCVSEIWELNDKTLTVYAGNYSFFRVEKDLKFRQQLQKYENQQSKIRQLKSAADQRRQDATQMEKFKFSRSISKKGSVQKRDAGSGKTNPRSSGKMRSAKAVEKRIEKMLEKEKAETPRLEKERKVTFPAGELKSKVVIRTKDLSMAFGSHNVFRDVNLSIEGGTRLGIIGRNGSGKSTLLKIITGNLKDFSGSFRWAPRARIGYFSQEHETLDMSLTILEEVLQGKQEEQTRARWILGRLNIRGDKVFQTIESLSLGERSKVALAKILFSDVNVLVLDEPTNHIELSAREAFEEALQDFGGIVLIASHDRFLLDRISSEIYDIEENRHFAGGYSEYTRSRDGGN